MWIEREPAVCHCWKWWLEEGGEGEGREEEERYWQWNNYRLKVTSYGGVLKYIFKYTGAGNEDRNADVIIRVSEGEGTGVKGTERGRD